MKGMKWWRSFRLYLCLPDRQGSIFCYITTKISRREATLTDYCVRQSVRYDSQNAERSAYRTSRSICEYFFVCNYIILYNWYRTICFCIGTYPKRGGRGGCAWAQLFVFISIRSRSLQNTIVLLNLCILFCLWIIKSRLSSWLCVQKISGII